MEVTANLLHKVGILFTAILCSSFVHEVNSFRCIILGWIKELKESFFFFLLYFTAYKTGNHSLAGWAGGREWDEERDYGKPEILFRIAQTTAALTWFKPVWDSGQEYCFQFQDITDVLCRHIHLVCL